MIGHVEVTKSGDATKNSYCRPVPHPKVPLDWLSMTVAFNDNQLRWFDDEEMLAWLGDMTHPDGEGWRRHVRPTPGT